MSYSVAQIVEQYRRKKRLKYIFFWGHTEAPGMVTKACLSQWYDCTFTVEGITYRTAEQYMMAQKALLFGDKEIYAEIMKAGHPKQCKTLGQRVAHFQDSVWDGHKYEIVVAGNLAKFSQNEGLRAFLLSSKNRVLVEASPYDQVWGVGMAADEEKIENPTCWKGENLLGFALMEVRDQLMQAE